MAPNMPFDKKILPVISITRRTCVLERTGDRTLDPQIKSLLLYQLSYPPDRENLYHLSEVLTIPVPKKVLRLMIIPSFLDNKGVRD